MSFPLLMILRVIVSCFGALFAAAGFDKMIVWIKTRKQNS
jgi:type IV secretory pathway VirB2 component (pilin)